MNDNKNIAVVAVFFSYWGMHIRGFIFDKKEPRQNERKSNQGKQGGEKNEFLYKIYRFDFRHGSCSRLRFGCTQKRFGIENYPLRQLPTEWGIDRVLYIIRFRPFTR